MACGLRLEVDKGRNLSKLLGTHLDYSFNAIGVDQFPNTNDSKNLDYLSTMKLTLAVKVIIYNHVPLSTTWFFIIVWGGSNKILRKIRGIYCNYLWFSDEQLTRLRVSGGNVA